MLVTLLTQQVSFSHLISWVNSPKLRFFLLYTLCLHNLRLKYTFVCERVGVFAPIHFTVTVIWQTSFVEKILKFHVTKKKIGSNKFFCFFLFPFQTWLFAQDAKNNVDADLVMLEELKVKCRAQTEQIMAWKKAYSMQVIGFDFFSNRIYVLLYYIFFMLPYCECVYVT